MTRESTSGFLTGLMAGALVGAAIALLYAPQTGSETRQLVKEKAVKAAKKIKESAVTFAKGED
jgi:gas vesicle protein